MLDTTTRKALLRVAHSAMDFAADLGPKQWFAGNDDEFHRMAEWMNRQVSIPDARHVRLALLAVSPALIYKNPQFATLSLRIEGTIPAPVIDAIQGVMQAMGDLHLDKQPNVKDIKQDAIDSLRTAAERLESVAGLVLTELQRDILRMIDGLALTASELEKELNVSRSSLYGRPDGSGGLKELTELGYVVNDRMVGGYYRPDSPPRPESN